ncbi:tRNA threonylcarbamoyladenosine biosynthesis protein TsaB [Paenibacillus sp. UNCCL117]|uniref:tRNA (adenosine(37)-N6)-threonylcarbamoyltransferase complex dimerization subunit type 1 TsaB n=1 Tax=unclassified Paenibacillus TaxID=185978 RepID=UPI00088B9C4E|nr:MULTISPECIES: tRNA (adenosine(37)-N6)-threonylcarbamoyltransferase complex dimerization subunit type 1 TsaB [unclassified Paenibacillus]SDE30953.1 tRNA threonylcarbamoyladenosine biosynthesis protein TsaB [Paenibacillus sp. cl123]SFW62989.1 tRNA threonylcarbamoyladenosine biosynthesis protein TsaB [Paenibacillus sp. UNCCL117]
MKMTEPLYEKHKWMMAVDTSTAYMTAALSQGELWSGELTSRAERNHSLYLVPALQNLMDEAGIRSRELGGFAIGVGPGSYTGVRIGVTVAKTFAWTHGLALLGVSSLEAMALGGAYFSIRQAEPAQEDTVLVHGGRLHAMDAVLAHVRHTGETIWIVPMIEARRGQAFTSVYEASPAGWRCVAADSIRLTAPWIAEWTQMAEQDRPDRVLFAGETAMHEEAIGTLEGVWGERVSKTEHGIRARFVAELGRMRWERGDLEHVHALVPNYTQLAEAEAKLLAKGK